MKTKDEILARTALYRINGGGIGSWLTEDTSPDVFRRLATLDDDPLSAVQLNQLLVLAHEAPLSGGFFQYYWLEVPPSHPYRLDAAPVSLSTAKQRRVIMSLDHLAWGLHRLYVDGLLYFGNVRTAFRTLRELSHTELAAFFNSKRIDTETITGRGPALPLKIIPQDRRYLISEMACKSYDTHGGKVAELRKALVGAYSEFKDGGSDDISIAKLLEDWLPTEFHDQRVALLLSASEILPHIVRSESDVTRLYEGIERNFSEAREQALDNTRYYLSMITDLDVYVATSMRSREHFTKMAKFCESVFADARLQAMNLRYFDPTLSAASGHEDKGLIECLMVKCAKALVYCGGEKESYGKDAEAAMALSLGRPVIFYCEERAQFYREVHPLTRLIQFDTGVAVGAMVVDSVEDVAELLARTFENRMVYRLERSKSGSLRLLDSLTASVVRIQTNDKLLSETFWNHYHREPHGPVQTKVELGLVPSANDPAYRQPAAQRTLDLENTDERVPVAARAAVASYDVTDTERSTAPLPSMSFPMTLEEIFDGVSKAKRSAALGAKRFDVFSRWVSAEKIGILDAVKVLRFVEVTLTERRRSTYAYAHSDLDRWYSELSSGAFVGSDGTNSRNR